MGAAGDRSAPCGGSPSSQDQVGASGTVPWGQTVSGGPTASREVPPRPSGPLRCFRCGEQFRGGSVVGPCPIAGCAAVLHRNCVRPHIEAWHPDHAVPPEYQWVGAAREGARDPRGGPDGLVGSGRLRYEPWHGLARGVRAAAGTRWWGQPLSAPGARVPPLPTLRCQRCERDEREKHCPACRRAVCAEQCWEPNAKRCWDCLGLPPRPSGRGRGRLHSKSARPWDGVVPRPASTVWSAGCACSHAPGV